MTEEQARNHPGVMNGTRKVVRGKWVPGGWITRDIDKTRASCRRHDTSEKGRAAKAHYSISEKGRAARARYNASEKGHAAGARYRASELGRINSILKSMRYENKLADARDVALLQQLKERRTA